MLNKIKAFNKEMIHMGYHITVNGENKKIDSDEIWDCWKYLTPKEFIENRGGVCYDYVSYQEWWFKNELPEIKTEAYYGNLLYIDGSEDSHSFQVIHYEDKVYLFEASWLGKMGVRKFDTLDELLSFVIDCMINDNDKKVLPIFKSIKRYNALDDNLFGRDLELFKDYFKSIPAVQFYHKTRLK